MGSKMIGGWEGQKVFLKNYKKITPIILSGLVVFTVRDGEKVGGGAGAVGDDGRFQKGFF